MNTFIVKEEATLRGAGLGGDEGEVGRAWLDVDDLLARSTTLTEVILSRRRHFEIVMTETGALHVQLEVEQRDTDCLPATYGHRPVTVGAAEVLVRIVRTRYVAVVVQYRTVWPRTILRYFEAYEVYITKLLIIKSKKLKHTQLSTLLERENIFQ